MKNLFLVFLFFASTASFASTIKCTAPQNNPNAFLADSFVLLKVSGSSVRLQQYSNYGNPYGTLMRDYLYTFSKVMAGTSKVKNMSEFVLQKEIKSYGDSLHTIYLDQAITQGKNGALIFTGQGYSWDWNYCRVIN